MTPRSTRDILMVILPPDVKADEVTLPLGSLRVQAWVSEEGLVVAPELVERCAVKMARYLLREVARRRAAGNTEPVRYEETPPGRLYAPDAAAEAKIDIEVQP